MPASFAYITEFDPWGTTSNDAAMDTAFGAGSWDKLTFTDAVANGVFTPGQYQFLFFDGSDGNGSIYESFLDANRTTLEGWTYAGGNVVLNAGRNTATSPAMNVAFGVTLTQNFDGGQASASAVDPAHPIFVGPQTPVGTDWTGSFFAHD